MKDKYVKMPRGKVVHIIKEFGEYWDSSIGRTVCNLNFYEVDTRYKQKPKMPLCTNCLARSN